ncbi:MAG: hypothetical protein AAGA83_27300 [Cyanobacteria bacterium P01_F01_bin.116]
MGFLDFFRERPSEEAQLDMFGQSQGLIKTDESSRRIAQQELQQQVKQRGGNDRTHATVNRQVTQNMLGHSPRELYEGLELPLNDRRNLPKEAKEALMVGDIAARNQIESDDAIGHQQIVQSAGKGSKKARKLFPFW